jgi:hypothetical protein
MSKPPIKIIAVFQIVGGLFSILFMGWALVTQMSDIISTMIVLGELLIDIFAVVAGITLWRGTAFGRRASMVIQAIQLPKITSPAVIFIFSFGFDLWLHASSSVFGVQTAFFGSNQVFLNVQNATVDFGVSITAIIALVILSKYVPAPRTSPGPLPPSPPSAWPAI